MHGGLAAPHVGDGAIGLTVPGQVARRLLPRVHGIHGDRASGQVGLPRQFRTAGVPLVLPLACVCPTARPEPCPIAATFIRQPSTTCRDAPRTSLAVHGHGPVRVAIPRHVFVQGPIEGVRRERRQHMAKGQSRRSGMALEGGAPEGPDRGQPSGKMSPHSMSPPSLSGQDTGTSFGLPCLRQRAMPPDSRQKPRVKPSDRQFAAR